LRRQTAGLEASVVGDCVAGVAKPAPTPATPISRWRKLSSVLTGMKPSSESPLPMMKPQMAIAMY
jgi:hypothetical protein